ncbi:MAG: phage tail assembly chaperone [Devosia sp.]|nr:phage tail assembly chaperone [Devosia sp.]
MKPFPWRDAMQFGLGVLKLPPEAFWKMSPRELAAAARPPGRRGAGRRPGPGCAAAPAPRRGPGAGPSGRPDRQEARSGPASGPS